jgi:UDP-2,3-diacylglucosamine pyrophosphatase LpxH
MARKRLNAETDKETLQAKIREHAASDAPALECARRIIGETKIDRTVKYVASLVSMERGTHKKPRPDFDAFGGLGKQPRPERGAADEAIRQKVEADPNRPALAIAREILAENPGLPYHVAHAAHLVRQYKKEHAVGTSIAVTPDNGQAYDKYDVVDGTYVWRARRGPIAIPVELADQMFYEYSRHGLDMSQSQMRQKHDLKIWEWNSIKNTLFMYKDSNIISPHTEDNTPKDQLQQMIDERMGLKMKDKQRLIETSYNRETIKRYKKVIEKDQIGEFALEKMIDELNETTADWKTKTATVKRTGDFKTERKWLVATVADLHIGCRAEGLQLTPDYSPEQARHLLDKVARRINAAKPTDVTLCFLGDVIESFTGLNHPNSWQSVEFGMTGAKVIKEAISVIEEFVAKIDNVREILAVSGNHDRMTASKKEDSRGQIAEIIFYMLQRLYDKHVDVQYSDTVLSKQIDGIQYVMSHGDKKTPRDGKQAVIDYGDSKLFNVIIEAHTHSRKTSEDERTYRRITSPAIFTGNRYSEENAWHARPGFLTFENDGTGKPIMTDHTIA